jgi:hypothetical protein
MSKRFSNIVLFLATVASVGLALYFGMKVSARPQTSAPQGKESLPTTIAKIGSATAVAYVLSPATPTPTPTSIPEEAQQRLSPQEEQALKDAVTRVARALVTNDLEFNVEAYVDLLMPDVLERAREVAQAVARKGWKPGDIVVKSYDISEPEILYERSEGGRYEVRVHIKAVASVLGAPDETRERDQTFLMAKDTDGLWKLVKLSVTPLDVQGKPLRQIPLTEEDKKAILELARVHASLFYPDPDASPEDRQNLLSTFFERYGHLYSDRWYEELRRLNKLHKEGESPRALLRRMLEGAVEGVNPMAFGICGSDTSQVRFNLEVQELLGATELDHGSELVLPQLRGSDSYRDCKTGEEQHYEKVLLGPLLVVVKEEEGWKIVF